MACDVKKIDSNITGLAFAEEECLKTLPTSPIWYELEPNSYSDFGGEISTIARTPINPSRQRKKGTITDLEASGGFNSDYTLTNLTRMMQGFFFADAREKFSTAPLNGTNIPITLVSVNSYDAASGFESFKVGDIVKGSNFTDSENNGISVVTVVATDSITVDATLTANASPSVDSKVESVGFEFPTGDLDITVSGASVLLESTLSDFTTMNLNVGEWVFVGGDETVNQFATNDAGYARIKSIEANVLTLDQTTFEAVTELGTGLEIQMFFGTVIRNENDVSLIKRRSYNIERTLGQDDDGTQSEYLEGAIPNEFTLNIPSTEKMSADLSFVALDSTQRTGIEGIKTGDRISAISEDPFNTSSDVYRMKMNIVDPLTLNPTSLFSYVTELSIAINNNVTSNKAIGVLGSFDATAGYFEVSGSVTAYFSDVNMVKAVRNNADVSLNVILAQDNGASVFDIPLLSLGGGSVNVEEGAAITIPVETMGAECEAGYTLLNSLFSYVPDVAMP